MGVVDHEHTIVFEEEYFLLYASADGAQLGGLGSTCCKSFKPGKNGLLESLELGDTAMVLD